MIKNEREKWFLTISASGFLFLVLYVYEGFGIPAGISATGHGLLFRSASFGLLAGTSIGLNEFYLRRFLKIETTLERFFWYLWELLVIWNLTYGLINYFWDWGSFSWFAYIDLLGELTAVMIVPFGLTELYRKVNKADSSAEQKLIFESENDKERLALSTEEFLYATSSDNYVTLYYTIDGSLKTHLLRNSLKSIEKQFLNSAAVVRCHRSYIINPRQVIHFSESSRGGEATLPRDIQIPVSNKYLDQTKSLVQGDY